MLESALILLALSTIAVAQNGNSAQCVQIEDSWRFCRGLQGLFIDFSLSHPLVRSYTNITYPPAELFHRNFRAFINEEFMPDNRTSSYLRDFKTTNNCPSYTHDKRRFLVSIYCYDIVNKSSNCPGNRGALKPLCKESCLNFVSSTQNTFNDPNMCPPSQSANQNRTNVLQGLSSQCDGFPFSGAEGQCLKGDQVEPDTCGYILTRQSCDANLCPAGARNEICTGRRDRPASAAAPNEDPTATTAPIIIGAVFVVGFGIIVGFYIWKKYRKSSKAKVEAKNNSNRGLGAEEAGQGNTKFFDEPKTPEMNVKPKYGALALLGKPLPSYDDYLLKDPSKVETNLYSNVAMQPKVVQPIPSQPSQPSIGTSDADNLDNIIEGFEKDFNIKKESNNQSLSVPSTEKAQKRISSLIVDQSVSLEDLLRYSLMQDQKTNSATGSAYGGFTGQEEQAVAHRTYNPTLADELELVTGDVILVSQKYDDGWAFGMNLTTGQIGVFPSSFTRPAKPQNINKIKTRQSKYGDLTRLNSIRLSVMPPPIPKIQSVNIDSTQPKSTPQRSDSPAVNAVESGRVSVSAAKMTAVVMSARNSEVPDDDGSDGASFSEASGRGRMTTQSMMVERLDSDVESVSEADFSELDAPQASFTVSVNSSMPMQPNQPITLTPSSGTGSQTLVQPTPQRPPVPSKDKTMTGQTPPTASINTLIDILEKLSKNDRESKMFADLNTLGLDNDDDDNNNANKTNPNQPSRSSKQIDKLKNRLSNLPPQIRDSIVSSFDELDFDPNNLNNQNLPSNPRFSFSALMSVLNDPQLKYTSSVYIPNDEDRDIDSVDGKENLETGVTDGSHRHTRPISTLSDLEELDKLLKRETMQMNEELVKLTSGKNFQ